MRFASSGLHYTNIFVLQGTSNASGFGSLDDFESLGTEALSAGLMLKNYEVIGISPEAYLSDALAIIIN